jgi:glycogen debranching enzyme
LAREHRVPVEQRHVDACGGEQGGGEDRACASARRPASRHRRLPQSALDTARSERNIPSQAPEDVMAVFSVAVSAILLLVVAAPAPDSVAALAVAKFPIEPSPLAIRADVRPRQYVGAVGRAAAWLGSETGEAELWVHPFKLASDFQLEFKIPDYVDPLRGSNLARTVEVRPELTTITYTHATFTVRQHILAPLEAPGLLVLLDVETLRPLEVLVKFRTVFQYAWPGSFGGQYTFWNDDEKAFVLSESRRERSAAIGSPWATTASSHPAHALADAPNVFTIPIDTARAAREFVPIAIAAGTVPRDSVYARYHTLIAQAEELYDERRAHVDALLATTASLDSPDDELDRALAWSKVNLDEQLVCNPDLGCGLVAGWGTSGVSTRPGFGWFFGGDAAINTFAMDATGQWDAVAQGLRFLGQYQREDGKITHEISQAAARIPWFTEFPYAYYHADTTPYWIVAVWRYWRASGDDQLVRDLWPAVQRAYAWCLTVETDGDGIIENTTGGLGAIEIGSIGSRIHQDIYLAAVWIKALEGMQQLAAAMRDDDLASAAADVHATARSTLNRAYWRADVGHHAFAILQTGETNDELTVWPATAAAFQLFDRDRGRATLAKLAGDEISTDWGARMLSSASPLYDPVHYNMGAVWPFVTGFVSWGQYNYRRPWAGYPLIDALKQVTFDWARGRHPELLSGRFYRPLDEAVPHQFFATSMLVSPIMSGMLGWDPDAPRGRVRIAPQLPPQWPGATWHNLRVGASTIDVEFVQSVGRFATTLTARGPAVTVDLVVPIPSGAEDIRAVGGVLERRNGEYAVVMKVSEPAALLEVRWTGGLQVEPPTVALEPGQRSAGVRVIDFGFGDGAWRLIVEGERDTTAEVRLHGQTVAEVHGAQVISAASGVTTLGVTFPEGTGRVIREAVIRQ